MPAARKRSPDRFDRLARKWIEEQSQAMLRESKELDKSWPHRKEGVYYFLGRGLAPKTALKVIRAAASDALKEAGITSKKVRSEISGILGSIERQQNPNVLFQQLINVFRKRGVDCVKAREFMKLFEFKVGEYAVRVRNRVGEKVGRN